MTDFAAARRHMVDSQVRPSDVTDMRLIAAMLEVPRERFVPPHQAALAYLDTDLPTGEGRRLIKPMVLAKLMHAADIGPDDRVLDVGCLGGYAAAVLARLAGEVIALEQDAAAAQAAGAALGALPNVTVATGPLAAGWPQGAPYDVILLEGATAVAPHTLGRQLKEGGRLVGILGAGPAAKAMLYTRSGDELGGRPIFDATAALLPGFGETPVFAF